MIVGILTIAILLAACCWLWSKISSDDTDTDNRVNMIDAILPQTQCGQCGYAGCRPYAEAIANGEATIYQCPPGGRNTIWQLARLLNREVRPVDSHYGKEGPKKVAYIDENVCIGCVKCIEACPVDAIVGAHKQVHTVIADLCTGCELCVPPCPVDCISMMVTIQGGKRVRADEPVQMVSD